MTLEALLRASVLACTLYLLLVYGMYVWLMLVGFVETRRRLRERAGDDLDLLAATRFAPGVSVIIPAYNESIGMADAVRSLLEIDYPDFEVIVVNDGSTDDTLAGLVEALGLVPAGASSRAVVPSEPVTGYYSLPGDRRLLVVDKANGGKADALNAGLNHCRHRYVCAVDADMVFTRTALSRAMREIVSDPAHIVGLTSFFEIAREPARSLEDGVRFTGPETRPIFAFQTLDFLRSFFNNRIPWARHNFMLCAAGAFQIWRRDLVDEVGGWSPDFTCEDIELTFRVHRVLRDRGASYRIACLPDCVGVTEGPDTFRKLVSQRERWQRVILETCWDNRRMCFNPRYGKVGLLGLPYYLLAEIVAPVVEVLALATLTVGAVDRTRGLAGLRARHALDHAREQRAHDRGPPHARSQREDLSTVTHGLAARPDACRDDRLSADPRVGTGQGDVGVRSGRQVLAEVRAQHTGGDCMRLTRGRGIEDLLLLLVAVAAAAVAVLGVVEASPPDLGLWLATASALALALTATFVVLLGGVARRTVDETLDGEWDTARALLSALPDGLLVVAGGRIRSVNRGLCDQLGFDRDALLGTEAPFPFWPPEHRHELDAWHAELDARGEHVGELTFRHWNGGRLRVLVAGRVVSVDDGQPRYLVTVRDVSESHRRERRLADLSVRDPETGLFDRHEFEARLGAAVRRATASGTGLAVVLAELGVRGRTGEGVFRRPEALIAVERLARAGRAGDELARTRDGELAWILPETDGDGAVEAIARLRAELAPLGGLSLTAGVCDLATAGDGLSLYALADRALERARRQGVGTTARYDLPARELVA